MKDMISIIIPAYNAENTLERCLNSILQQNHEDFEIIIVNDHSADSTKSICNKYVESFQNIHFFDSPLYGASNARNFGLEKASGKYISFIDADDMVHPDYCKCLYNSLVEHHADLCICGYSYVWESQGRNEDIKYDSFISNSKQEFAEHFTPLLLKNLINSMCNKLFLKELINFEMKANYKIGEDLAFNLDYLDQCKKVVYINEILYYYFKYQQSSAKKLYYHEGRFETLSELYFRLKNHLERNYMITELGQRLYSKLFQDILLCLKDTFNTEIHNKQRIEEIRTIVNNDYTIEICKLTYTLPMAKRIVRYLLKRQQIHIIFLLMKLYSLIGKT